MTEFEMAMAALRRPTDYSQRCAESQWNIDAGLGILDWNGIDMVKARKVVAEDGPTDSFKMSPEELKKVVAAFDVRYPPDGG
jgi:hypothetical protein